MRLPIQTHQEEPKSKGFIKSSILVLFAFCSVFFSRMLGTLGVPSTINFLHFIVVPFACWIVLSKSKNRDRKKNELIQLLLVGLLIFLVAILISTMINDAGIINAALSYLLLAEPFIFIIAIVGLPLSAPRFIFLQMWIRRFCLFHIFWAVAQRYVLRFDLKSTGMEPPDNIQGVFFLSGAGHVIGTSVSLSFGLYYLFTAKDVPLWFRTTVMMMALLHMLAADAKQVLLALMVAWVLLFLTKLKDIAEVIKYLAGGIFVGYTFLFAIQNIPAFSAFNTWMRPEIYGPQGEATLLKTASFRIIPTYYQSFLNWFFGLGPGHTVGRLGGWMLKEYELLLKPLGATTHPASKAVWRAVASSWLGSQSSLFSPLFGWAGVWGDLGFVGLGAYLFLAYLVWHYIALDDIAKLLMLSVFVFGLIFSQLEEPGYTLTIACIIGFQWHENKLGTSNIDTYRIQQKKLIKWL
jgi:hypothetical protein